MSLRRLVAGTVALVCAAVVAAPAAAAQRTDPRLVERGRTVAQTRCAACHAVGRSGDSVRPSAPPFRTLPETYPVADLIAALSEGAAPSSQEMHRFRLPAGDARALTAYILSMKP